MNSVRYQIEPLWSLWDELLPLLVAHWREVAKYQDIQLDPDVEAYTAAEAAGMFVAFTARDWNDEGRLVGYAGYFVRPNMHYRQSKQAVQDVIYIDPSYRLGFTGIKLIKYADEELAKMGVQVVMHHVKVKLNWGPVLERLGYTLSDLIYTKRLDHGDHSSSGWRDSGRSRGQLHEQEDGQERGGRSPAPGPGAQRNG